MIKIRIKSTGVVELEFEAEEPEEAWSKIGFWQHIFILAGTCGACASTDTYLSRRVWDKGEQPVVFYEAICTRCSAKLGFWPPKDGNGFEPKLKDKNKDLIPDCGWHIYVPPTPDERRSEWASKVPTKGTRTSYKPKHDNMYEDGSEIDEADIPFAWLALLLPALMFI